LDSGDDARGAFDATDAHTLEGGDEAGADGAEDATPEDAPAESASDAGNDAADAAPITDANGPPFLCGPSLECFEVTQFCGQVTGPHGGTFYNCNATPDACAGDLSCTCLAAQGIVSPCSEDDGGITVVANEP
jgi:hypothetical protein